MESVATPAEKDTVRLLVKEASDEYLLIECPACGADLRLERMAEDVAGEIDFEGVCPCQAGGH